MSDNNQQQQAVQPIDERSRKVMRIAGIVLIVVILIALGANQIWKKDVAEAPVATDTTLPEGCKPGFLFSEITGKPCPQTETPDTVKTDSEGVLNTSGYEAAIRQYAGKVVIFGEACKPISMISSSVAPGTRILVANNSNASLALAVGGKSEILDGYHYFTTTLKNIGNTEITCDAKTAATVIVK